MGTAVGTLAVGITTLLLPEAARFAYATRTVSYTHLEAAQQPELPTRAEALAHIQVLCRAYYPQFAATCPGGHMPKIAVREMCIRDRR